MAAVRPADADAALARRNPDIRVLLIFGPDLGLVRERADVAVRSVLPDAADPFALVRLEGDEVAADPRRLVDETRTIGLFGGERVVRLRAGNRNIVPALEPVLAGERGDALVVVEAGDLKKGAALRSLCEASPRALAIACYPDTERDLARLVDTMMAEAGHAIDRDARALLVSLIGGDRRASRGEIEKLILYAGADRTVTADHVRAIVGDASALALDDVVDAALAGDAAEAMAALARALGGAGRPDAVLGALLRALTALHPMALAVAQGASAQRVIDQARPQVHFSPSPKLERALGVPDPERGPKALRAGEGGVLPARRNAALAPAICERTVLQVAMQARPRGRGR